MHTHWRLDRQILQTELCGLKVSAADIGFQMLTRVSLALCITGNAVQPTVQGSSIANGVGQIERIGSITKPETNGHFDTVRAQERTDKVAAAVHDWLQEFREVHRLGKFSHREKDGTRKHVGRLNKFQLDVSIICAHNELAGCEWRCKSPILSTIPTMCSF